ncbi:MAG: NADH-quinone oxidoreductase subunit H [Ktedonobacterales bacterium]
MNGIVAFILTVLLYPGIIAAGIASVALTWARDSARAVVGRGRFAPPLSLVEEVRGAIARDALLPAGTTAWVLMLASSVAPLFPLLALIFLPVPGNPLVAALGLTGDLIAEGGLLLGLPLMSLLIGWSTPSPYTRLAADRNVRLLAGAAVPMILALTASAEQAGTLGLSAAPSTGALTMLPLITRLLAAVAFALTLPVLARVTPMREDEGDVDLVASELTELSGRDLACFRIAEALQLVAVAALFTAAFVLPIFATIPNGVTRNLFWLFGVVLTALGIGAWEGIAPRAVSQENRPPLSWWLGVPVLVALLALVAAAWATRGA